MPDKTDLEILLDLVARASCRENEGNPFDTVMWMLRNETRLGEELIECTNDLRREKLRDLPAGSIGEYDFEKNALSDAVDTWKRQLRRLLDVCLEIQKAHGESGDIGAGQYLGLNSDFNAVVADTQGMFDGKPVNHQKGLWDEQNARDLKSGHDSC